MKFQALRISLAAWSLVIAVSVLLAANEWIRLPEDPLKGWSVFEGKGCIKCHSIHGHGGKDGPDLGEKLFSEKGCIKCHSVGGKGGTIGPKLDEMKRYASPLYMAQAMWNHGPEMEVRMKELGIRRPRF